MNQITKYIFAILSLIMLAGCSESEKNEVRPMDTLGTHLAHPICA